MLQPYIKSWGLYSCPSGPSYQVGGSWTADYANPVKPPQSDSYTYNGLLHNYPQAGVLNVTEVPLMWEGNGKARLEGAATSNPALLCDNPAQDCRFVPSSATCDATINGQVSTMFFSTGTVHSQGAEFVMADGHAKWRRLGGAFSATADDAKNNPKLTDCHTDPGLGYDAQGFSNYYWGQAGPQGQPWQCHPYLFRPDYQPSDLCW